MQQDLARVTREGHAVSPLVKKANARASLVLQSGHANASLPDSPRRRGRPDSPRKGGGGADFGAADGGAVRAADFDELFRDIGELLGSKAGRHNFGGEKPREAEKPAEKYEREWSTRGLDGPRVLRTGVRHKVERQIDAYRGSQVLRNGLEQAVRGHLAESGRGQGPRGAGSRAWEDRQGGDGRGGNVSPPGGGSPQATSPSPERPLPQSPTSAEPKSSAAAGRLRPATAPLLRNFVEENKKRTANGDGYASYTVGQLNRRERRAAESKEHREWVRENHRAILEKRRAHLEAVAGARDEKERRERERRVRELRERRQVERQAAWLCAVSVTARVRALAQKLREDRRTRLQRQKKKFAAECISLYQWRKNQMRKQEQLKDLVNLAGESLRSWVRRKLVVVRTRNAELLGVFLQRHNDSNKLVRSVRVFYTRMLKVQKAWRSTLAVWRAQQALLAHQWSQFEDTGRAKGAPQKYSRNAPEKKGGVGSPGGHGHGHHRPGSPPGKEGSGSKKGPNEGGRGFARRRSMMGLPPGLSGGSDVGALGAAGTSRSHGVAHSKRVPADIKAYCIREELARRRASYQRDAMRFEEEMGLYRAKEEVEMTRVHFLRLMGLPACLELDRPAKPVFRMQICQEEMEMLQLRATQLWKRSGVAPVVSE